jgi:hypothetical protein
MVKDKRTDGQTANAQQTHTCEIIVDRTALNTNSNCNANNEST